jgi:hypothetical protein
MNAIARSSGFPRFARNADCVVDDSVREAVRHAGNGTPGRVAMWKTSSAG